MIWTNRHVNAVANAILGGPEIRIFLTDLDNNVLQLRITKSVEGLNFDAFIIFDSFT